MAKARKNGLFSFFGTRKAQEPTIKQSPAVSPFSPAHKQESAATEEVCWAPGSVVLGDYLVEKGLGEGGMGEVYLVKSQSTGQQFAVKRAKFQDRKSRNQFLKELHTWIDLPKHDNLVAFRFFRTVGNEIVIFSEYAPDGSLVDWIDDKRLYEGNERDILKRILDISIQFAWGLKAAHTKGLVHQDVKPGNVLLGTDDAVKIKGVRANDEPRISGAVIKVSDFGLTRAKAAVGEIITFNSQHKATATHAGAYTPAYCSPEQKKGQKLSHKTDIWSWALSVLTMFKGDATWPAGEYAPLVLQEYLENGPVDSSIPKMPQALTNLLGRCFKDEDARPESMSEIVEDLKAIYKTECRGKYTRPEPIAVGWDDQGTQKAVIHDRRTETGVQWSDPREWLATILEATGRDMSEVEEQLPQRRGSRRAQAIADLAAFEEVRDLLEELISEGRENIRSHLATLLVDQALVREQLHDLPGAIAAQDRAIQIYEHLINREGRKKLRKELAIAYIRKAITLMHTGDTQRCLPVYEQAIELYERLVNIESQIELADDLALAYMDKALALERLGDLRAALRLYDRAIDIHEHLVGQKRPRALLHAPAVAYMNKARAIMLLGDSDRAVPLYDQAIALLKTLVEQAGHQEFLEDLAITCGNKAIALENANKHEEALKICDEVVELYEDLVYKKAHLELCNDLAATYLNKANIVFMLRDFNGAVELCDKAIDIRERLIRQEGHMELQGRLAMCYVVKANAVAGLGKYEEAMDLQDCAVAVYESLIEQGQSELADDLATAYMNKGALAMQRMDYDKAVELFDKAAGILSRLVQEGRWELTGKLAKTYLNKGESIERTGSKEQAAGAFVEAICLTDTYIGREKALALIGDLAKFDFMALTFMAMQKGQVGDLKIWAEAQDRSIAIYERLLEGGKWSGLAEPLAEACIKKADAVKSFVDPTDALEFYNKGIKTYEGLIDSIDNGDLLKRLAGAYAGKADVLVKGFFDHRAALEFYRKAIQLLEKLREWVSDPEIGKSLAQAYRDVATNETEIGNVHAAIVACSNVIDMYEHLAGMDDEDYTKKLAEAYFFRAHLASTAGDFKDAVGFYDSSIRILERWKNQDDDSDVLSQLGKAYSQKGIMLMDSGDSVGSLSVLEQAVEVFDKLVSHKKEDKYRGDRAMCQVLRAMKLPQQGKASRDTQAEVREAIRVLREEVEKTARSDFRGVLEIGEEVFGPEN